MTNIINTGLVEEYPKETFLSIFERLVAFIWPIISPFLHERGRRLLVAAFALFCGRGGIVIVHNKTGISENTIRTGIGEIKEESYKDASFVRRPGGGRKRKDELYSVLLDCIVKTQSYGDPMRVCSHTTFSTRSIPVAMGLMIDILMGHEEGEAPQDPAISDRIATLIIEAHKINCEVAIAFTDTLCVMKINKVPLSIEIIDELYNDLTEAAKKEAEFRKKEAANQEENSNENGGSNASITTPPVSAESPASGITDAMEKESDNTGVDGTSSTFSASEANVTDAHNINDTNSLLQEEGIDSQENDEKAEAALEQLLEQLLESFRTEVVPESATGIIASSPAASATPSDPPASAAPSDPPASAVSSVAAGSAKTGNNNSNPNGRKKSDSKSDKNRGSNQKKSTDDSDEKGKKDSVDSKETQEKTDEGKPSDTSDKSSKNDAKLDLQKAKFEARTTVLHFPFYETSGQIYGYLFTDDEHRPKFTSDYGSVSPTWVRYSLARLNYSKQQNRKLLQVGKEHPQRDLQFRLLKMLRNYCILHKIAYLCLDVKKKEPIGWAKIAGKIYRLLGEPVPADDHDFPLIKMIPLGLWDILLGKGHMFLNISHDTAEYTCNCMKYWWDNGGKDVYPDTPFVVLQCDCGGSNGKNHHAWHNAVQEFATYIGRPVLVCHTPPGASKWNPIEHMFFPHISRAFAAQLLTSVEKVRDILNTLKVKGKSICKAVIDEREYQTGVKIPKEEYETINMVRPIEPHDLNYIVFPTRKKAS